MYTNRPDVIWLDTDAVHRIMRIQGYGRNSLAKALGRRDPSEVGRWINGRIRITLENAADIAKVLGCTIEHLTGKKQFVKIDLTDTATLPGTPDFYLKAIEGKWRAISHVAVGKDIQGHSMPDQVFEWDVELIKVSGTVAGTCICRTPGFEHGQYNLKGAVTGRGFLMLDGVRGIPDGAEDFFRALLRIHSDGRTKSMEGGYAMFWAEFQQIFHGSLSVRPLAEGSEMESA